jgi:hypothetical protein
MPDNVSVSVFCTLRLQHSVWNQVISVATHLHSMPGCFELCAVAKFRVWLPPSILPEVALQAHLRGQDASLSPPNHCSLGMHNGERDACAPLSQQRACALLHNAQQCVLAAFAAVAAHSFARV